MMAHLAKVKRPLPSKYQLLKNGSKDRRNSLTSTRAITICLRCSRNILKESKMMIQIVQDSFYVLTLSKETRSMVPFARFSCSPDLPWYPDPSTPELNQKIVFLDTQLSSLITATSSGSISIAVSRVQLLPPPPLYPQPPINTLCSSEAAVEQMSNSSHLGISPTSAGLH